MTRKRMASPLLIVIDKNCFINLLSSMYHNISSYIPFLKLDFIIAIITPHTNNIF